MIRTLVKGLEIVITGITALAVIDLFLTGVL